MQRFASFLFHGARENSFFCEKIFCAIPRHREEKGRVQNLGENAGLKARHGGDMFLDDHERRHRAFVGEARYARTK
jgi:hypothetical protein